MSIYVCVEHIVLDVKTYHGPFALLRRGDAIEFYPSFSMLYMEEWTKEEDGCF